MAALALLCRGDAPERAAPGEEAVDTVASFLAVHWDRPAPLQGVPPSGPGWFALTTDLDPAACSACHPVQHVDWSTSLHARAYSPGLEAQLLAWLESDPATVAQCMSCHGPLSEQLRALPAAGGYVPNPRFDRALERGGVMCAACHVRGWRRYGPPRRDGSLDPAPAGTPHEGANRTVAFEDSRFCAACHQFDEPAPNGKPLQNTVREWEVSSWAGRGVSCQGCHMPDRRHLWRGIHDPTTVRAGATPAWRVSGDPRSDAFEARLALANTGTGHHLPTYVTPAIDLEIAFLDALGDTVRVRRATIHRDAFFDGSEWIEREDTRIAAGGRREIAWRGPAPASATRVAGRVHVRPDAFYEGFFESLLAEAGRGDPARTLLEEALAGARASPYDLWRWEEALAR